MTGTPDYVRDTIAAAATPPGRGGVGIVRISGPAAADIAVALIGKLPSPRHATTARFRDPAGSVIDSGIALWFPAPHSYTGEDVLELQGHGGPVVMSLLVDAAISLGARHAGPGEFTRRAFMNGKLDLNQAEAVADLVEAGTAQAARAAQRSLSGAFSRAVEELIGALTETRLQVEAAIDFPEEELDFLSDDALRGRLDECRANYRALLARANAGRVLRDGYQVVIVGPPNAGKSSLLNLLCGQESAIVTEVAGTTRDILRERVDLDGLVVEFADTAGLRENPDTIEAEGIRRARQALADADAILLLRDAADPGSEAPDAGLPPGTPVLLLNNKIDLTGERPGRQQEEPPEINVSALTGAGIEDLKAAIRQLAGYRDLGECAFTVSRRHVAALATSAAHFEAGRKALAERRAGEILAEELRLAQAALAEVGGGVGSDELLGRIFAGFCIGK